MSVRFVIRPSGIITTPKLLKEALQARDTRNGPKFRYPCDYTRDFMLWYPGISSIRNAPQGYSELWDFFNSNKAGQRRRIAECGIPTPTRPTAATQQSSSEYIVRPLRHSQGRGWRLTSNSGDFDPNREYIQEVFPKTHEYRIVFVKGTPLYTLLKRIPEGLAANQPWNHANGSSFVTVENSENNRLRHTDVYERLKDNKIIQLAHLVGVDVMYNKRDRTYSVCEFNFSPSVTIASNLQKVVNHVLR